MKWANGAAIYIGRRYAAILSKISPFGLALERTKVKVMIRSLPLHRDVRKAVFRYLMFDPYLFRHGGSIWEADVSATLLNLNDVFLHLEKSGILNRGFYLWFDRQPTDDGSSLNRLEMNITPVPLRSSVADPPIVDPVHWYSWDDMSVMPLHPLRRLPPRLSRRVTIRWVPSSESIAIVKAEGELCKGNWWQLGEFLCSAFLLETPLTWAHFSVENLEIPRCRPWEDLSEWVGESICLVQAYNSEGPERMAAWMVKAISRMQASIEVAELQHDDLDKSLKMFSSITYSLPMLSRYVFETFGDHPELTLRLIQSSDPHGVVPHVRIQLPSGHFIDVLPSVDWKTGDILPVDPIHRGQANQDNGNIKYDSQMGKGRPNIFCREVEPDRVREWLKEMFRLDGASLSID